LTIKKGENRMKNIIRFTVAICLVLVTLLSAFPASAGPMRTEVTGWMDGIDAPANPEYRDWLSGHIYHWRNESLAFHVYSSDPRLTGYDITTSNNGDVFFSNEWDLLSVHIFSQGIIYKNEDFTVPLWSCLANGWSDAEGYFASIWECHGMGEYAGLVAHLDISAPPDGAMIFEGEILAP
jgi:hypothetical protein